MKQNTIIAESLKVVSEDRCIEFSHISLFLAIYHQWQANYFTDAIPIVRKKLMALSKIRSTSTYHKCIKDLVNIGAIRYEPSYHPSGSVMYLGEN